MQHELNIVILRRDCDAMLIPSAAPISLPKGTEVTITQSLGGSYTVNVYGNLARIDAKDADAIGFEPKAVKNWPEGATLEEKVWAQLKTCYDPEIPINIVDLGLVYNCDLQPIKKGFRKTKKYKARIQMTLTAPGCGMGPVLAEEAKQRLLVIDEIAEAEVEIVFDPPWTQEKMSEAARLELGWL